MRQGRKSVLYIDYCRVRDKYDFLQELALGLAPYHLFLLDGANVQEGATFENMTRILPPPEVYYLKNLQLSAPGAWDVGAPTDNFEDLVALFKLHAANVNDYVDSNIVRNSINTAFLFSFTTLRMLRPELVMIWNAFHPLSQVAAHAARLSDVPVCYAEFGVLPGSMNVDFVGQMGESLVARDSDAFNALPIVPKDIEQARFALDIFHETGLNRRAQPDYGTGELRARVEERAAGRPVVFFAGHNDLASGMYPYTQVSRDFHSPIFSSSGEGARAMFDIAAENDWFLLYKPHPFFLRDGVGDVPPHVMLIGDANINECVDVADVTCTILSQVSYVARIRKKPVVMLGYNQMRGKGVAYEAYTRDAIAPTIANALENGVTQQQETAWVEHVARLLRYYLYRWNSPANGTEGQEPALLAERLKRMIQEKNFQDFGDAEIYGSFD